MPIKGISEITRLPRMGKIRLGIKKKSEKSGAEYPEKTDYFVVDPNDEAIMEEVRRAYGEKPKALDIIFPIDDPDQIFPQFMKRYSFSTLICKGDGVDATEIVLDKDGKKTGEKQVKCEGCPHQKDFIKDGKKINRKCRPMASLQFLLPKVPGLGVWQLDTSSFHSIINVNAGLKLVQTIYKRISGVPLRLILSPRTVKAEGRAKTVYVISLSIEGTLQNAMRDNSTKAISTEAPKALLPAPDETHEDHFVEEPIEAVVEQEEQPEDHEDGFIASLEKEPEELKVTLKGPEAIKLLGAQLKQLGYAPALMTAYIQKQFQKTGTKFMTEQELGKAVDHLGKIIQVVELGTQAFTRDEIENYVKNFYKRDSLLGLSDDEIDHYANFLTRAIPKGKQ